MKSGIMFEMPVRVTYDPARTTAAAAVADWYRVLEEAAAAGLLDRGLIDITYGDPGRQAAFVPDSEDGEPAGVAGPAAAEAAPSDAWTPAYSWWRHGGWYVGNVRYPSGAAGCVSRNYADGRWRIVCDTRPDAYQRYTYPSRDAAARAERQIALAQCTQRISTLAARLYPAGADGAKKPAPNSRDANCAACSTLVKAGAGVEVPGTGLAFIVFLHPGCAAQVAEEQHRGNHRRPDGH